MDYDDRGDQGIQGQDELLDDLDAFNDDTFGGEAEEWREDDHEELAQTIEEQRNTANGNHKNIEDNMRKMDLNQDPAILNMVRQPQQQFHDPAIMSVSQLPPGFPPPPQIAPPPHMQQQMMQQHMMRMPPPPPQFMQQPPPHILMQMQQQQQQQQQRTVQDLEREMMRNQQFPALNRQRPPPPMRHQQQYHQHQHQQRGFHQHQQEQHYHNRHHNQQHRRNFNNNNNNNFNPNPMDDKNDETFGADFVEENRAGGNNPRESQQLMTPSHVHALGVLHNHRQQQSTGNPHLDLELEKQSLIQQQQSHHQRGFSMDEYSGLMSAREKQWIINIQLSQLKCENPFVDDYYYTVHNQKKEFGLENVESDSDEEEVGVECKLQPKHDEEGPQLLLLSESKEEYTPVQFRNSLGKLQAVSVHAPRRIIDVAVVINDPNATAADKDSRNYKNTLMEIERLYAVVIEVEDAEKKLAALPTNTIMRKQVQEEKAEALHDLCRLLSAENRFRRYLVVRKGKALLRRSLRHIDPATLQLFCSTLFQLLPLASKRDRDDKLLPSFWQQLKRHLRHASFALLQHYLRLLNAGADNSSKNSSYSTFKLTLGNQLGVSILLLLVARMGPMINSIAMSEEEKKDSQMLLSDLFDAVNSVKDIAEPLEKINLDPKAFGDSKAVVRLVAAGLKIEA